MGLLVPGTVGRVGELAFKAAVLIINVQYNKK
jgi:hypothetical protein